MPAARSPRLRRAAAGVAVVLVLLVSACSSGAGSADPPSTDPDPGPVPTGPQQGGTLDVAVPAEPISWSPAGPAWTASELQAARAVYDRLVARDADDVPTPDLAQSVTPNQDDTAWTITLRPGVTFHDGTPLDASVVAANLEAQRTAPDAAALLEPITSVAATDPSTVVVTTSTPWSTFLQVLSTQVGFVAAPAVLTGASATPVGTGPFAYQGTAADGTITLARNPSYWKAGLPHLDAVRLVPVAEASDRVDGVIDGTYGLASVDEPRQLSRLDDLGDDAEVSLFEDRNEERPKVAIAFETGRPPFDHITARRAVALATDRDEILDKVFDKQGTVSRGIISDASPWFSDHSAPTRDVGRAKEEAEAYAEETGQPLAFTLMVPPDPTIAHVASLWRVQLANAGIDVQLQPVDQATLDASTVAGQYQAALMVGFDDPHPDLYEPQFRGIPAEQPAFNTNLARYVNPVVTKAFADARQTHDVTRQVDDYRILQEQLTVDIPWLFLVQVRTAVVGSDRLRDVTAWSAGSGAAALGEEGATVSLAQIWLAP